LTYVREIMVFFQNLMVACISMKKFCVTITKFNPFDITLCFQ